MEPARNVAASGSGAAVARGNVATAVAVTGAAGSRRSPAGRRFVAARVNAMGGTSATRIAGSGRAEAIGGGAGSGPPTCTGEYTTTPTMPQIAATIAAASPFCRITINR